MASVLSRLRASMRKANIDAFIIPTTDAHASEYTSPHDDKRAFVSGFTGSAGTALVSLDDALLWTDGRYFLQASRQLDSSQWKLMRSGEANVPTLERWLSSNLRGKRVGFDPLNNTVGSLTTLLQDSAMHFSAVKLVPVSGIVEEVWDARPAPPAAMAMVQPEKFAGRSVADKLAHIQSHLVKEGVQALVVCALDEVMWLLNLRGGDVPYNPVLFSYALVTASGARIYVDEAKLGPEVRSHLSSAGVEVRPYGAIFADVKSLGPGPGPKRVWFDASKTNSALWLETVATPLTASGEPNTDALYECFFREPTPIGLAKAIKNSVELAGAVNAHIRDGVALAKAFARLEALASSGDIATLDEVSCMEEVVDKMRAEQDLFVSLSFSNICGVDRNGAIIHYKAERGGFTPVSKLHKDAIVLIDSGGQYRDGTTDVTRVLHFGVPTKRQRQCYTLVLKGHIALSSAVFPRGQKGSALDPLARLPLWRAGLDYRHGTGHGIGSFLNVHEGPHGIHFRRVPTEASLESGMLVTNEPGYYEEGEGGFGIRIENVMVIEDATNLPNNFGGVGYLCMRPLTLVPLEPKLIDVALLTHEEVAWINSYHARCLKEIGHLLSDSPEAEKWLAQKTRVLVKL
jgi:Xaa-Pro aminopeptidase